jgi:hypothetical protein
VQDTDYEDDSGYDGDSDKDGDEENNVDNEYVESTLVGTTKQDVDVLLCSTATTDSADTELRFPMSAPGRSVSMVVLQRSSVTALQVAQLIYYGTEKTLHSLKPEYL